MSSKQTAYFIHHHASHFIMNHLESLTKSVNQRIQLRQALLQMRHGLTQEEKKLADARIHAYLSKLLLDLNPQRIACYLPIRDEPDIQTMFAALSTKADVLLPKTESNHVLSFWLWEPSCAWAKDKFGLLYPNTKTLEPDCLVIPCVGLSGEGVRIGYGAGCYDKTLAQLGEVITIGIAYDVNFLSAIPANEYDQRLNFGVTDLKSLTFA